LIDRWHHGRSLYEKLRNVVDAGGNAAQKQPRFRDRRSSLPAHPPGGPIRDHTLCTMLNDLRVPERHVSRIDREEPPATLENALPLLPGGQVVAGSNPVSPTGITAGQRRFRRNRGPPFSYPVGVWIATRIARQGLLSPGGRAVRPGPQLLPAPRHHWCDRRCLR
jgi:hypothetical protein